MFEKVVPPTRRVDGGWAEGQACALQNRGHCGIAVGTREVVIWNFRIINQGPFLLEFFKQWSTGAFVVDNLE